ncbi:MAG: ROK family transcriptional regulator [Gammaproteobacteria bacterium]|nr:ROK family transcriptional regulator [Gammaproteobacteria bacterium]MDE0713816.1 ROK family transcriptional regulator [Gammaproteobacteria bacterium]
MRSGESIGLRAFNERLMISAIRQAGALSKAEIARTTGLSGQAATVIVNSLLDEGLLVKREKVRGQIGKPFTPIALNPEGAYSLGVKIGRRSLEVLLVDFCGDIVASRTIPYHAPFPSQTMTMAMDTALELVDSLKRSLRARIVGLGVAMPWVLHEWFDVLGLEREAIAAWREIDVAAELEAATGLSASLYNDATAACAAEMIAGDRISRRSALYIYLGTFVGGGVVIGGRLYRGEQLNAGALGSMPIGDTDRAGNPLQLIHQASVIDLERALADAGFDESEMLDSVGTQDPEDVFSTWLDRAVEALSRAVVSAMSIVDFETVVIDGLLRPDWRRRVVDGVAGAYGKFDCTGLSPIEIATGSIGPKARVLGAALLPLIGRFSPDTELLVKVGKATKSDGQKL